MCIKDYEIEIGGQGPVRAVELLGKNALYLIKNTGEVIPRVMQTS
jgi:hypothetical protein